SGSSMRSSSVRPVSSNRQSSTLVALAENSEKLTPSPSHVAPRGLGEPSATRDFRMEAGIKFLLLPRLDAAGGAIVPDNLWSGGEASQQIADADGDQRRCDRLILDHVAEARDLLLRLAGGLVVKPLSLRLGVAGEFAHLLLHPAAHFAGGTLE